MTPPHVRVEAWADYIRLYEGEETPRAFRLDGIRLSVDEILGRWYRETHCCFRIHASDAQQYVLRYAFHEEVWELVMQERSVNK